MNSEFTRGILALTFIIPVMITIVTNTSSPVLPIFLGLAFIISKRFTTPFVLAIPIVLIYNNMTGLIMGLNATAHFPYILSIPFTYMGILMLQLADIMVVKSIILPLINKRLPRRYAI